MASVTQGDQTHGNKRLRPLGSSRRRSTESGRPRLGTEGRDVEDDTLDAAERGGEGSRGLIAERIDADDDRQGPDGEGEEDRGRVELLKDGVFWKQVRACERRIIEEVLIHNRGNVRATARDLELHLNTLNRKIADLNFLPAWLKYLRNLPKES